MKRVAVLGTTGMLGSMVHHHLASVPNIQLKRFARPGFDAEAVVVGGEFPELAGSDYVVNCIGVIKPYCRDDDPAGVERAIRINALFPHQLARAAHRHGVRLIQIATDCVFSGSRGKYTEADDHDALDVYGKTKSLGELHVPGALNIRCSIIGPEGKGRTSLMEWFLAQPAGSTVNGFTHHLWNGVTTLQFARLCERIILTEGAFDDLAGVSPVHHFRPNEVVSKYELLCLMAEAFGHDVSVAAVSDVGPPVDRTLATQYSHLEKLVAAEPMRDALAELAEATKSYRAASEVATT